MSTHHTKTPFTTIRSRWLLAAVALVALAAFVAACGSSSGASNTPAATPATAPAAAPSTSASATGTAAASAVAIQNFAFAPKTLTVAPGTKVTWTNNDSTPHNVMSTVNISLNSAITSTFASSNLNQGQTFSFTFTKKGVYFYECSIHKSLASMHAEVIVK